MTDPVTLGYGNNKWLFDANTEMITLSNSKSAIGTYDMYSGYTGAWASFVVPAGKKFIALKIQLNVNESSGSPGTGLTFWECGVSTNQSQGNNPFSPYDMVLDCWAAGEHVNITFNTADYWFASITGILTDI